MQPSTLAPGPRKPPRWWVLVTAAAGAVGALSAIAAGGSGTYDVAPFQIELRARPAFQGKTEFSIAREAVGEGVPESLRGRAEAGTHRAPIVFRATITGVTTPTLDDIASLATPGDFADKLAQDGKDAATSFGIKLGLLAISGALAGGLAVSLFGMRWRRLVGALFAGVVTFGVIGLLVQQTYDKEEFRKTGFVREGPSGDPAPAPSVIPSI